MIPFLPLNSAQTLLAVAVVVSTITLLKWRRRSVRGFRLPPGPAPLPLVGNLLSINAKKPWMTYTEWGTRYGPFYFRIGHQSLTSQKQVTSLWSVC